MSNAKDDVKYQWMCHVARCGERMKARHKDVEVKFKLGCDESLS